MLPVTAGDYFELRVNATTTSWNDVLASPRTWFALEVVETADAAEPPSDITLYKPGQPAAGEILLRLPVARRTLFKANLAGSHGSAGTAPAAQADFDVRHNGVSFATIRFAADATSATFIAAGETVLEPGDVLSVVAPAPADASLADIGLVFAGTLIS